MYRAVFIGRDLGHSIIESRYGEVVNTNDREFRSLMNEVVSDM